MNLNTKKWCEYKLDMLFKVDPGKYYYQDEYTDGTTPYCSASNINNGVSKKIDLAPDFNGNQIITGKVGCTAFYQKEPFCATSDVNVLTPLFTMTPQIGWFIVTIINKNENYRWNYGRQCRVGNTKKITIKLPTKQDVQGEYIIDINKKYSSKGFVPDWQYMENYIKSLPHKPISTKIKKEPTLISSKDWIKFRLGKLIEKKDIYKSKAHAKVELEISETMKPGYIHFVSRTETNNGIDCYVPRNDFSKIESGNAITIGDTTATIHYQSESFVTGDHMIVMRASWLNKYTGMFIVSLLRREQFRYSYGRAYLMDSILNTKILLPSKNNQPDWQYIENYIKSLPYSDRI